MERIHLTECAEHRDHLPVKEMKAEHWVNNLNSDLVVESHSRHTGGSLSSTCVLLVFHSESLPRTS